MRRCQNHGLTRPPSPFDLLTDVVWLGRELWDWWDWKGEPSDCLVAHPVDEDVDELEGHSYWRRGFLGRYGRQSMVQWDNVLVAEMNRLLDVVIEIMKKENELVRGD